MAKRTKRSSGPTIVKAIRTELNRQGRTRYQLAKALNLWPQSLYRTLSEGSKTTRLLDQILTELNLTVVRRDQNRRG